MRGGGWGPTRSASELAPSPPYTGLSDAEAPLLTPFLPSKPVGSIFAAGQPGEPSFQWEALGSPGWAAFYGFAHIGLCVLALGCPFALVITDALGYNTGLLQECSYAKVGNWGPWCAWSRGFVVGLPFLATSVLATSFVRFVGHRVLYVRLLRTGTMMGHEPLFVRYDWNVLFLFFAYVMSMTHFYFTIRADAVMLGWAGGWIGTTVFLFVALYFVYTTEAAPSLIHVFAESPYWAREHMGRVRYLPAAAVHHEAKRVYADWHMRGAEGTFNDLAASIAAGANPHMQEAGGLGWAHSLWTAKVLSSQRLTDAASEEFRVAWTFIAVVYFCVQLAVFGFCVGEAVKAGIRVHDGFPEASFGMLSSTVQALFCLTAFIAAFNHTGGFTCLRSD